VKSVKSGYDGYFETEIEMSNPGLHKVSVAYSGYTASAYVYVREVGLINEDNSNKATKMAVQEGRVDVILSTKKLEVAKDDGNVLYVTIINNKRDAVFSVSADAKNLVIFTPASIEIKKNSQKTLPIYVEGHAPSRYTLNVEVYMEDEMIKNESVQVVVFEKSSIGEENVVPLMPSFKKLTALVLIFLIVLIVYLFKDELLTFGKSKRESMKKDLAEIIEHIRKRPSPLEPLFPAKRDGDIYLPKTEQIIY